jgi:hypothetical protein
MLKRAMEAQSPQKFTGGLTVGGKYTADPEAGRNTMLTSLENQLTRAVSAKDLADTRAEASKDRAMFRSSRPLVQRDAEGRLWDVSSGSAVPIGGGFQGAESTGMRKMGEELSDHQMFMAEAGPAISVLENADQSIGGPQGAIYQDLLTDNVATVINNRAVPEQYRNAVARLNHAFTPEVHRLYGAALTGNELSRADSWLPASGDNVGERVRKAKAAMYYAQMASFVLEAQRANGGRTLPFDRYQQVISEFERTRGTQPGGASGGASGVGQQRPANMARRARVWEMQ